MEEFAAENIELEDKDEIMEKHCFNLSFPMSINNREIAEDLTQDILVKCYKSLHTYKRKAKLKTWVWRIAINHCKDFMKSWYHKNVIKQIRTMAHKKKQFPYCFMV